MTQVRYVATVKFYLNIVIKNKKEAITSKSMEKSRIAGKLLGAREGGGVGVGFWGPQLVEYKLGDEMIGVITHALKYGLAGKIANRLVSDDLFSEKLGANLEASIPQRLKNEAGLTATAVTQFHRGNFVVVLISVEDLDFVLRAFSTAQLWCQGVVIDLTSTQACPQHVESAGGHRRSKDAFVQAG